MQCCSYFLSMNGVEEGTALMFDMDTGRGGALLKRKPSRRVLMRATQKVLPGPSRLADSGVDLLPRG